LIHFYKRLDDVIKALHAIGVQIVGMVTA